MHYIFEKYSLREPLSDEILKDLYYHTEQPDKKSSHTGDSESEINYFKWAHSDPEFWEKYAPALIEPRKKHIIISSPLILIEHVKDLISLMQELSWLGFPLYCFNKNGKPERIDPQKIKSPDFQYLENLFKKSELLPEKAIREKIASCYQRNPKDFPPELLSHESSFILDHFRLQQIMHKRNRDNEGIPFQYKTDIPWNLNRPHDYLKLLQERSVLNHHCRLQYWGGYSDHDDKEVLEFIKTTPVKRILLSDFSLAALEELPEDIEELHLESNRNQQATNQLNLSRFTHLKKLTIERCSISGLENLPVSLQALTIKGIHSMASLLDWSDYPALKEINLSIRVKEIPDTPARLEDLTLRLGDIEELPRLTNPHGLKKLIIIGSSKEFETLKEKLIEWLKPCSELRHFESTYFSSEFFPNKTLPPHLISLTIYHSSDQSIVLPDNLEELWISTSSIKQISLPGKLKKATFRHNETLSRIDTTNAQNLQTLVIEGSAITFSRSSLPGLEALSRLENLTLLLYKQTFAEDPPSLANLPIKVLFATNTILNGKLLLDKGLQILAVENLTTPFHCNLQKYSELRHLYLYSESHDDESIHIVYPPKLISLNVVGPRLKNSPSIPHSIHYSFMSEDKGISSLSLLCNFQKGLQQNSSKTLKNFEVQEDTELRLPEFKYSSMGSILSLLDYETFTGTTSDAQQRSNIGLSNDTYTDPQKTIHVHYRIYCKIQGELQPVPASLHRREIFDRCTWQKNTFDLVKSQAPEEFKPASEAIVRSEYTQEDRDKLTAEEYFVQRPVNVARAGTHRISLDTLKPYDNITHICLPQNSRLLFNPVLYSYELEWTTQGPEKATLEYQFSKDNKQEFSSKIMSPTLDEDLIDKLVQLFSAPKNPSKASHAFTDLKKNIMKVRSKSIEERWGFCQKELARYCRKFGNVTLKNRSGWKKLEEILVEAKGSCQERSMVFVMLCHFLGVEARLIGNDIHAFVELKNPQGIWEPLQLKGHEAQIKETAQPLQFAKPKSDKKEAEKKEKESADSKKSPSPLTKPDKKELVDPKEPLPEKKQEKEIPPKDTPIAPDVRTEKWRRYFRNKVPEQEYKALRDVLEELVHQTHPAITVDDTRAARDFCVALSHSFSKDQGKRVLYLESPKDLHAFWTLFQMDETGAHGRPGPLQTLLDKGVIMINWAGFNRTQMAAYKSLMDDPPSFLGTPIPKGTMHFIHLLTPEIQGCTSFTSRVKEFKWPKNIPWPQPPEATSPSDKKEDIVSIDLYGDRSRWESALVGTITPTEAGLSFKPKQLTELADAKDSVPLCINLVDVPEKAEFEAFMTRLKVASGFLIANGQEVPVPATWRFQYQAAPKDTELSKQIHPVAAEEWLSPKIVIPSEARDLEYDRCFLNSATLEALEAQQQLQAAETSKTFKMIGREGWLQSSSHGKVKQLVQTHSLTPGEKRRVSNLIAAQKETVEWVDLTKPCDHTPTVFPSTKALGDAVFVKTKDRKAPHKNHLLETPDPDFVAEMLARDKKHVVSIPIQTITRGSELIESIDLLPDESEEKERTSQTLTKKPPRFRYQTKPMLDALRAGKTVVLHGHLSDELYRSLHTLFAPDPHLKLITGTEPERMPGQLIVLTEHLPQETHLARHTQSQGSLPQEALWPAYEERLKKEKIYDKDAVEKLKLLYTIAVQCLPQEAPHLSYAILKQCVMALKKSSGNDNPIKAWFQHEEPESVAYAQLNVFAKLILGPAENPTVRTEKLRDCHDIWKRLNCLNSTALREVIFDKKNPTLKDYETLNTLNAEALTQKLDVWLGKREYKPRASQADPYQKTIARMRAHLNTCGSVVLKGPPGSGKTWMAYQYCEEVGSPIFLANDPSAITKWKDHKPKRGQKAVLIVDEPNLKRRGTWEHLSSLISKDHHIVFTRNPNSYGGRVDHPILQKTSTVSVKKWTSQGLLTHILMPLCQKVLSKSTNIPDKKTAASSPLSDEHVRMLESLINIYQYVQTCLPPNQLSIRDLQQLILRWLQHPEREREPLQAAYEACVQEWGLRFGSLAIQTNLINKLQTEFPVIPKTQHAPLYQKALKEWSKDFYLIGPQKKLLDVMAHDLKLALDCYGFKGSDGAPLAKSGLLIEGPSGFGKSSLIRQFLISTDHKPLKAQELLKSKEKDLSNCFIQFTMSGDTQKDRELLRAAFHKGCKVILDELNLDPLIETELNHLLTGKTEGGEKGNPGFFVFATQNDGQMEGRKSVSPALLNRLHVLQTPECSPQHLLEAVQSALPHLSKEEQTDVVSDYLAEARADPANVNLRTFYQGLKEIKKDFPEFGDKVVVPLETVRLSQVGEEKTVRPEEAPQRRLEGCTGGEETVCPEETSQEKVLTAPKSVPLPTPPLPDPLPPLRGGEGTSDSSLSPPQQVGDGILAGKFGIFSSPEARKKLVDATWIYLPVLLSLATFSMAGISIAAANQMKLEGMLKSYPDYASQYFQPDIKRGEMIAFAMIVAAMAFLITSVYNRRKANSQAAQAAIPAL